MLIQPKLVSILDFHGNPINVWVVEAPSWLAKFLSESSVLDEENLIEGGPPRSIGMLFLLRVNPFQVHNVCHCNYSGCKVEEIVDQEQHVPLAQGSSPNNFHGIASYYAVNDM